MKNQKFLPRVFKYRRGNGVLVSTKLTPRFREEVETDNADLEEHPNTNPMLLVTAEYNPADPA